MSIESHLEALKRKHGDLEAKLHDYMNRPAPDQTKMTLLKREKLRLKEEIEKLGAQSKH